ncbi:MAG: helix-turn-helix transcriptional regulator [Clostridiales bacterium]|nr:helix-turn-helix transcriptional regulator [Clostridiales bacterium]
MFNMEHDSLTLLNKLCIIRMIIKKRVMLMTLSERIKLKIKELIETKCITIYELAKRADLTEACIRNWYTKRNYTPSLEAIEKICFALDIPVTDLVKADDQEFVYLLPEDKELIENWHKLDKNMRELIMKQIDIFLKH